MRVLNNIKVDKSSLNREKGTFKLRSTTEYPVLVQRMIDGKKVTFYEILSHDPKDINLSRVQRGAVPLVLGHDEVFKVGKINAVEIFDNSHTVSEVTVAEPVKERIFDFLESEMLEHCSIEAMPTNVVRTYKIDNIPAVVLGWEYINLSLVSKPGDPDATITRSSEKYDYSEEPELMDALNTQITRSLIELTIEVPEEVLDENNTAVDNEETSNYNENNISDESAMDSTESKTETENCIEVETNVTTYETLETYTTTTFQTTTTVSKTELSIPYGTISRSQTDLDLINKDLTMSIFKIARAIESGTLSDEMKKGVLSDESGTNYISNATIARSFRAGTGVNTAGFADEGGNLIPKDMSSDYVKLIYDRYVLAESGVPFIQLSRSCIFPVILSGGTATWIDENSPATPSDMKTSQKTVKAHYVRIVSDISNTVMKEADSNISVEELYANDWFSQLNQAVQKAYFKGNPSLPAEAGSPTGIVTILQATPALAATNVLSFVGTVNDVPSYLELNSAFAVLEDAQAPTSVVYVNSQMKAKLLSTPTVPNQAVFMATDSGSGRAKVLGRDAFVVPASTLDDDELLIASPASSFVATFHGGIEIISDSKILATTNQHRFVVRAAYDVFFRYPRHFVFMKKT